MISSQASSNSGRRSFHILTFGCQMNQRDSGWLACALRQRGYRESALEAADFVFINTCSVREKPEKKVVSAVRRARLAAPAASIVILGCVAQQLGDQLYDLDPAIVLVAGTDAIADVPDVISAGNTAPGQALLSISREYRERPAVPEPAVSGQAFVTIMQGCNNYCSYCIVPYTRGPCKFRKTEAILRECRDHIENGAIELTLLGQNVNAWRDGEQGFASLLRSIADLPGLKRLRYITAHPKDMTGEIIDCFGDLQILCPCLHLALQSGSDTILKAMRRGYTRQEYLNLVAALKAARPDIALTTDLIVGFPGESEADFLQTLDMVEKCGFITSYSFCYSDRPGTRAAPMPDKIAPELKLERLGRLQALQEDLGSAWLAQRVGTTTEILIEKRSPRGPSDSWQGRDPFGIPVHARMPGAPVGKMAKITICEARKHCLVGEIVSG